VCDQNIAEARSSYPVGSGAPTGNTNALKPGRYTAEAIARRRQLSELIRMARVTLAELREPR
jgi:hypothetical protein